ncbi:MAG: esterase-like activity of phytase family protein, partial [Bacteroidaceae bacterium]|nr:esterase-like activity of phytase family protein [Bacteroidaceae bacterium]
VSLFAGSLGAQTVVREWKAVKLDAAVPSGNYSGLTWLGGDRYAVVDDKSASDGFYVWTMTADSLTGRVLQVESEPDFRASSLPNRDGEGIALAGDRLLLCGEQDNRVLEYTLTGALTGKASSRLLDAHNNAGLESLTYDERRNVVWTMEENGGQGRCRLFALDRDLQVKRVLDYVLEPPTTSKPSLWYAHGVSALCALPDGQLLVLERELRVPPRKVGAWCRVRLFIFHPETQEKREVWSHRTRLGLANRSFANYEGLCLGPQLTDGTRLLLLIADSQNRYAGVLHDWLKPLVLRLEESAQ